jgi:hypothetical protein
VDLEERECECVDWMLLVQDFEGAMNISVSIEAGNAYFDIVSH